jgi:hypothetical protein
MHEFSEGQDVLVSTEIAQHLGHHPWEITKDLDKLSKFNEIVDYFGPYADKAYILGNLTKKVGKDDSINHVWKYVNMRKMYDQRSKEVEELQKGLKYYER